MDKIETYPEDVGRKETAARLIQGGSILNGIAGAAASALAIFALANIVPTILGPIAIIVLGVAFVLQGGAIATRFSDFLTATSRSRREVSNIGAGLTGEVVGGVVGGILGILAILKISPVALSSVAVMVFGITMVLSSGVFVWFDSLLTGRAGEETAFRKKSHETIRASGGIDFILGLSALELGIISLLGVASNMLMLVALLAVGFGQILSGSAMTVRMWKMVPHAE